MSRLTKSFFLGFVLALIVHPSIDAQTTIGAPTAANTTPASQAPDEVMKKLSDLVHADKYAEAQQTVAALLILYPDDQRLVKAKVLLDKASVTADAPSGAPSAKPETSNVVSPQPASNLSGMDRVDYNALIELGRRAQQTTDLEQQNAALKKFMTASGLFLQKHPTEVVLWQLRVVSAISLNDPMAGYEAGQKLLAAGAADSTDPNLQHLLAQLKNQGWLGEEMGERFKKQRELTSKYGWMLGTWRDTYTDSNWTRCTLYSDGGKCSRFIRGSTQYNIDDEVYLSKFAPVIEINRIVISNEDDKHEIPSYRGTLLDSGELLWEFAYRTWGAPGSSPREWIPVSSCELNEHKRTMKMIFPYWNNDRDKNLSVLGTHLLTKRDTTH